MNLIKISNLFLILVIGIGCGKATIIPTVFNSPQPSPGPSASPTPTPNPLIGIWKGQDWSPGFQDIITLNSDGTGTQLSCTWTFNWIDSIANPGNVEITNVTSPDRTGDQCDPRVFAGPRLLPYNWIISYTHLSIEMFFGQPYSYARQ